MPTARPSNWQLTWRVGRSHATLAVRGHARIRILVESHRDGAGVGAPGEMRILVGDTTESSPPELAWLFDAGAPPLAELSSTTLDAAFANTGTVPAQHTRCTVMRTVADWARCNRHNPASAGGGVVGGRHCNCSISFLQ